MKLKAIGYLRRVTHHGPELVRYAPRVTDQMVHNLGTVVLRRLAGKNEAALTHPTIDDLREKRRRK
jgi:hypothetical protein